MRLVHERSLGTILKKLKSLKNERNRAGMARFGIEIKNAYGISIPVLRKLAKEIGTNHPLALKLWKSGIQKLIAGKFHR